MAQARIERRRGRIDRICEPVARPHTGVAAAFFGYRPAFCAVVLIAILIVVSILAPLFAPYGRDAIDLDRILASPSPGHVLGTDELGRDLFSRLLYGGRFTLLVALLAVAFATVIGLGLGAAAGYLGGGVDVVVTGLVDLFSSVPVFLVLLVAAAATGGRLWAIPVIIGATAWMETARVVRAEFMSLRSRGFVEAARSVGSSDLAIVLRHLLPNSLPPVIVAATIGFAQVMLIESALSFLGFGVQPPLPTWGNMLYNAHLFLRHAPVAAFIPGFLIFITSLCFNIAGQGLQHALGQGADRKHQ